MNELNEKISCSSCGEIHELSELEITHLRPDIFFSIPEEEHESRTWFFGDDACQLQFGKKYTNFIRVILPLPVHEENNSWNIGIWVEISRKAFMTVIERWDDPNQSNIPPFLGEIANDIKAYSSTLGLKGNVQLSGPDTVPIFKLESKIVHPLVSDQVNGISKERIKELQLKQFKTDYD